MFIYKITFPNGLAYIGKTMKTAAQRFSDHVRYTGTDKPQYPVNLAIAKYGAKNCIVETLCECYSVPELNKCESALIAEHGTYIHAGGGYNVTYGGRGNNGWRPSEETKALWRKQRANRVFTPEWRAAMSAAGKGKVRPRSKEHAAKIGAKLKGRVMSPEWIEKIRLSGIGRRQSEDSRQKRISALKASPYHHAPEFSELRKEKGRKAGIASALARASRKEKENA